MTERPILDTELSGGEFRKWYWLKEELVLFCRKNGIPTTGSKADLTDRISHYLDTGEIKHSPVQRRDRNIVSLITPESLIESDIVCSEKHRAFFRSKIGDSFSFNVAFQKWLKSNAGKTYQDAIDAYHEIKRNKLVRKKIDSQFEYNTYIRDFYEENKGVPLEDAIKCWKHKKSLPGHNRYEASDLEVLRRDL